jgi:transcriptional regulator with XRE-family HTH domain
MDDLVEILELIKERRKEKGITQSEMATKLGISQSAYKDIEIGKTDLKVRTLQQIADILGIDLFSKKGTNQEQSLIAVNPENIYTDLYELKRNQEDMKNEINEKLDAILNFLGKGKK